MKLRESLLNRPAKIASKPLSSLLTSNFLYQPSRYLESYLSFLLGKGAGGTSINEEVRGALANIYRKEPIVFDVGTNIGDWSQKFLELQPNGKIFQFEPSENCQEIIKKLDLPNTTLITSAVGREEGEAYFYASSPVDPVDCSASLYERRDGYWGNYKYDKKVVNVTTIDKVISDYQLDFVDFIKLDIEGHELEALAGASNSLKSNKIGALAFEFGASNINSKTFFHDFWDLFKDLEFSISRVTPSGRLVKIDSYYEDLEYFRGATNYIVRSKIHPYVQQEH
jgi:FkbM family methyltransferase